MLIDTFQSPHDFEAEVSAAFAAFFWGGQQMQQHAPLDHAAARNGRVFSTYLSKPPKNVKKNSNQNPLLVFDHKLGSGFKLLFKNLFSGLGNSAKVSTHTPGGRLTQVSAKPSLPSLAAEQSWVLCCCLSHPP